MAKLTIDRHYHRRERPSWRNVRGQPMLSLLDFMGAAAYRSRA
jgi:hypothetical protein